MKRLLGYVSCILVALLTACHAGDTRSYTDKITGGSLAVTNLESGTALELKSIMFKIDTATITNTCAISHIRNVVLPDTKYTEVVTNGWAETNSFQYTGGAVWITNSITVAVTTNNTNTQVYDQDDFGMGLTWEYGDEAVFSFTDTNAVYLIRVYEEQER